MKRAMLLVFTACLFGSAAACGGGGGDGDAGVLQFAAANFTVNEDGMTLAAITVRRVGGSSGGVSATIALADGTATGGTPPLAAPDDYDNTPLVVTFGDGDAMDRTATVAILDDTDVESNETVNLTLGSPTGGATVGVQTTAVLVIANNDSAGTFAFTAATASYNEDGTPASPLAIRRTSGSSGSVVVTYVFAPGTAAVAGTPANEPADVGTASGSVMFADQDTADKILAGIGVIQDVLPETTETLAATITTVTAGSIGAVASAVTSIVDDDTMLTLDPPAPAADGQFGMSLAGGGGRVVIGEPGFNAHSGVVRLFDASSAGLAATLTTPVFGSRFGESVAGDTTEFVVGHRGVSTLLAYDPAGPSLRLAIQQTCQQNFALALLPSVIAVCQTCTGNSGFALFNRLNGTPAATVGNPFPSVPGNDFGALLVQTASGNLLVGSSASGVGSFVQAGSVFIYTPGGTLLVSISNPFPANLDRFGTAGAAFGVDIAVGTPFADALNNDGGAVYVIDPSNGNLVATITSPAPVANGRFGTQLAQVRDRLAVYQPVTPTSMAGTVFIFDGTFQLVQTIVNPNVAGTSFGATMTAFDDQLLVGAPNQPAGAVLNAGQAFIIKLN